MIPTTAIPTIVDTEAVTATTMATMMGTAATMAIPHGTEVDITRIIVNPDDRFRLGLRHSAVAIITNT